MELNDKSSAIVKKRTPRESLKPNDGVRESLLSNTTSGIGKGEDDNTSVPTSFSSPDFDNDNQDFLTVPNEIKRKTSNCVEFTEVNIEEPDRELTIINNGKIKKDIENNLIEVPKANNSTIPDGGWGWVVVLSSFVISMIADGISFSFGLLYMEFLDEFKASKSTTAWIGSLFIAVPLLSGPVMSALVDRYGCRSMTILGGVISTTGFVLASISNSLEMMMLTFGVIAGLGLGLVYVTAVVSIAYWFEKKRNLAVGLGACGTGVGTFVYAPMTQYFIEEFGWRGTILLLAGTLLNLCVCGCVMRDPDWWILEQKKQRDDEKSIKEDSKSKYSSSASIVNSFVLENEFSRGKNMKRLITNGVPAEKVIQDEVTSIKRRETLLLMKKMNNDKKCRSLINMPDSITSDVQILNSGADLGKDLDENAKYVKFASSNRDIVTRKCFAPSNLAEPLLIKDAKDLEIKYGQKKEDIRRTFSEAKDLRPLLKQDSKENRRDWLKKQLSVNHHYLRDLKMPLNSISHRTAMLNIKRYKLKASSCPDIFKNSMVTVNEDEEKWYDDCVTCLGDMFNVELFKKVTFILLCVGTIIIFVWFIVPYFYLAEHMIHNGYSEDDGAVMISLIGITNTIGMVGLGWIGDLPKVSLGNLYAICLVFCGASVAAIPMVVAHYWILAFVCGAFGLLFAASFTFVPSLLVKLVSLDDFTAAYGLVLLAEGIGHLIGPPLS
ncbi:unnamed protein product, partial [Leptidea sinapis]